MTVVSSVEEHTTTVSPRRSPLAHRQDEFAARGVSGTRGVRLTEEDFHTQLNLRVNPENPSVPHLEYALNLSLPREPNQATGNEQDAVLWLGPDEWLVIAPDGQAAALLESMRTTLDESASTVDVSANRTVLRLAGPMSRDVLEKVCALDLHPRVFAPGHVAETLVGRAQVVLWQVTSEPAYRLMVRCSFADYLADLLLDAMAEFR